MTTNSAEHEPSVVPGTTHQRLTLDEQASRKGTRPIGDGSFYARDDLFDQPGELEDFLRFIRDSRREGIA